MAQQVTTFTVCDYPHRGKEVEATDTLHWSVEGTNYEVDTCEMHRDQAQRALTAVTQYSRTVKTTKSVKMKMTGKRKPVRNSGEIREWAKQQGIALSKHGRIPASVVEQFTAAQAPVTA